MDTPSQLKVILTSNVLNPLTLSSSRACEIPTSLRHDQAPDLTSCRQDIMDMKADIQVEKTADDDEQPIVKCKIRLTNKSHRDVKLPIDYLPLYTLNLEAYEIFNDGSSQKISRRPFKPRLMGIFEASVLRVGESRDYWVNLSVLFQFFYGIKYRINLQFKTRVGYSGVPYLFASNHLSLTVAFGDTVEPAYSHSAKTISHRTPLRLFCHNVKLIVTQQVCSEL